MADQEAALQEDDQAAIDTAQSALVSARGDLDVLLAEFCPQPGPLRA
jgi:hypothetical protein